METRKKLTLDKLEITKLDRVGMKQIKGATEVGPCEKTIFGELLPCPSGNAMDVLEFARH